MQHNLYFLYLTYISSNIQQFQHSSSFHHSILLKNCILFMKQENKLIKDDFIVFTSLKCISGLSIARAFPVLHTYLVVRTGNTLPIYFTRYVVVHIHVFIFYTTEATKLHKYIISWLSALLIVKIESGNFFFE